MKSVSFIKKWQRESFKKQNGKEKLTSKTNWLWKKKKPENYEGRKREKNTQDNYSVKILLMKECAYFYNVPKCIYQAKNK